MSIEENKALVRRWIEEFNKGNMSIVDDVFAPDIVAPGFTPPDIEGIRHWHTSTRTAFPDFQRTVEDLIAEGDQVVVRLTVGGTHQAKAFGLAPTGKHVETEGVDIVRIADGKIVNFWSVRDMLSVYQQLGVIQDPDQSAT